MPWTPAQHANSPWAWGAVHQKANFVHSCLTAGDLIGADSHHTTIQRIAEAAIPLRGVAPRWVDKSLTLSCHDVGASSLFEVSLFLAIQADHACLNHSRHVVRK